MRTPIVEFMESMPMYAKEEINGKKFAMIHEEIVDYRTDMPMSYYTERELLFYRTLTFDEPIFHEENKYFLFGHIPTFIMPEKIKRRS